MPTFNRREFLSLAGAAGLSVSLNSPAHSEPASDFTFLFITDTHLQPELNAAVGCRQCFQKARNLKADFAIQGGDHVFDALAVGRDRAKSVFDLYGETEQVLGMKAHHTLGNHDCFGIYPSSGILPSDPLYGKKMFESHFGKTYYSFDHKGVHFIVLDSIGITEDHAYEGRIGAAQMDWLTGQLKAVPTGAPVVVITHIPLVTAFSSYAAPPEKPSKHNGLTVSDAYQVLPLFEGHNVIGVLQGHTHVNEQIVWKGIPYITSGAVCGNWWHGIRMGTPEGFSVVDLRNGKLSVRYETFGFKSIAPHNT